MKDYTAEDLQNAFDKGRDVGRKEAIEQAQKQDPVQVAGFDVVIDESMPPNKLKFEQAQPSRSDIKQEPVAQCMKHGECFGGECIYTSPPQQKQEPVAWGVIASNTGKMCQVELDYDEVSDINSKWLVPLYTSPPQRPVASPHKWIGLTDDDLIDCESEEDVLFVRRIEDKLKEKNQ